MRAHKLLAIMLSMIVGMNTVCVGYAEECSSVVSIYGYIPDEMDHDTPVVDHSQNGLSMVDTLVPSKFQSDISSIKSTYPDVRNQGEEYGTCWAFSALGLMEYDLVKKHQVTRDVDLSELQLSYFVYNFAQDPLGGTTGDMTSWDNAVSQSIFNGTYLHYGGNYAYALRRLSQWISATNESTVPYEDAESVLSNGLDDSYAYNNLSAYLQNAYLINIKQNPDDVKEMIMEHGAVGISYDHTHENLKWNNDAWTYYDAAPDARYGHTVMVVGWDDTFSKENFTSTDKPSHDGAWLCRNSWGMDYYDYFWMSYETVSLEDTAYVFDCTTTRPYDNNYQLDGGILTYRESELMSGYNKFTVQNKDSIESETLNAVSVSFTKNANVNYKIDIYTSMSNENNPSQNDVPVASVSGTTTYAGVYTIPLETGVELRPGQSFYVVVTTDVAGALDCEGASNYTYGTETYWNQSVSQDDGLSYGSTNGTDYSTFTYNFRIKAFTTNNYKSIETEDNDNDTTSKDDEFTTEDPSTTVTSDEKEITKDVSVPKKSKEKSKDAQTGVQSNGLLFGMLGIVSLLLGIVVLRLKRNY